MKIGSSSDKYRLVAEINMIPFIDVALVLLIIFMVMTPFLVKEQIKINLPSTKSTPAQVDANRLVQVDVARDGTLCVDGTVVSEDNVCEAIRQHLTDPENQSVVIAADRDVPFEKVVVAMDAAKRCGAKRLGVSVKHDGSGPSSSVDVSEPKPRSPSSAKPAVKSGGSSTAESKRHAAAAKTRATNR